MKKDTQKNKVLNYMSGGNRITTFDCFAMFFITDLQGIIRDLKKEGYVIDSEWKQSDEGTRYKEYFLGELING